MIIREGLEKIKATLLSLPRELFIGIIIVLVGTASFGLGRLSSQEIAKSPVRILYPEASQPNPLAGQGGAGVGQTASVGSLGKPSGGVVASSKGSKYHFPWCPGAKSISEQNKISFKSAGEAESAGYTLASNCK